MSGRGEVRASWQSRAGPKARRRWAARGGVVREPRRTWARWRPAGRAPRPCCGRRGQSETLAAFYNRLVNKTTQRLDWKIGESGGGRRRHLGVRAARLLGRKRGGLWAAGVEPPCRPRAGPPRLERAPLCQLTNTLHPHHVRISTLTRPTRSSTNWMLLCTLWNTFG